MDRNLHELLNLYRPDDALEYAHTIPAPWYRDARLYELERDGVFAATWQAVGRSAQVQSPGQYFTAEFAGEPLLVARGDDGALRAFFNVCRHHAAIVVSAAQGCAQRFRCPYHGWTYGNDGSLKGMVEFEGVCNFERKDNGLVPVRLAEWEGFVFVNLDGQAPPLLDYLGSVAAQVAPLQLPAKLHFYERRRYLLDCNWKVFVDNYLDGGYHVPHAHKGLSSVIEYKQYTIENFAHATLQSSPLSADADSAADVAAMRTGRAFYLWLYPNFMINAYAGVMDTNLVLPLGPDRCEVLFDYYFADVSAAAEAHNQESIRVSEKVQEEDTLLCALVQKGLRSRAYQAGRLSVRREAGEHLFHRLLHRDLTRALVTR